EGVAGLLKLWAINTDPRTIPSIGPYYIDSYRPGISVTLKRNPNYWKTDESGQHLPYRETVEMKIIPNTETEKLKFLAGDIDSFSLRPQDLAEMVNKEPRDYTVYYGGATLGSRFIAWNENPKNLAPKYVKWFSNLKFRQAMSCFFDRARIVKDVYRGLGQPQLHFFPEPNPFYDPKITEQYLYDPARGVKLLAEMGIKPNKNGQMEDSDGNIIEYTLEVPVEDNIPIDIANIFADDLKKVGIKLDVKPVNFQKMVDSIVNTYDWQAVMVGLGVSYFPTQGSNVWQSSGNFHIWRPLQEKPATQWEARIDKLYQEGLVERDPVKAKKIWDEYQHIILDELPVMYTIRQDAFGAYRNKWGNIRYDTISAPDSNYIYLKP
ncbi:MAG TPA: ABC transporter substrate-binding protein, partial [Spirochaetia bacterium]|nr:ABC transporter substrate-binding protein [Spirochaetia bacterium]